MPEESMMPTALDKDCDYSAYPGKAVIDLAALRHNYQRLTAPGMPQLMAIVKADAYGHGANEISKALYRWGCRWFGISQVCEALNVVKNLQSAGITVQPPRPLTSLAAEDQPRSTSKSNPGAAGSTASASETQIRVFSWINPPGAAGMPCRRAALRAGFDVSASNLSELNEISAAASAEGVWARVHLKVDVGHSRAGQRQDGWPEFFAHAAALEKQNLEIVGLWSHLPCADDPTAAGYAETAKHAELFRQAQTVAQAAGIDFQLRHLAASPAGFWHPELHFDLIRWGIGLYGMSPNPARATAAELGLRPVMSLSAPLLSVKKIRAGEGVSYDHTWRAQTDCYLGLVPLGYADGIDRMASNRAQVIVQTASGPLLAPVRGRVCMDQFMIEVGTDRPLAKRGDQVEIFGPQRGAEYWAEATRTINYEVVTRVGARVARHYLDNTTQDALSQPRDGEGA